MYVLVVDIFAATLVIGGIALVLRQPRWPNGRPSASESGGGDPGTYARRIAGTMVAAFGFAIGLMVTLFHFASVG